MAELNEVNVQSLSAETKKAADQWFAYIFWPATQGKDVRATVSNIGIIDNGHYNRIILSIKKMFSYIEKQEFDSNDKLYSSCLTDIALGKYKLGNETLSNIFDQASAMAYANIIAYECKQADVIWDCAKYSKLEIDFFKKTIFGQALADNGCLINDQGFNIKGTQTANSNQNNQATAQPQNTAQTNTPNTQTTTPTRTTSNSAQQGVGTVKSVNNDKNNLLYRNTMPGFTNTTKEYMKDQAFYICGKWTDPNKKTKPRVFIQPYEVQAPYNIKISSGQGAMDCILYFKTQDEARNYAKQVIAKLNAAGNTKIKDLGVYAQTSDENGYFEINTNLGKAYIRAMKLHENVNEELNEESSIEDWGEVAPYDGADPFSMNEAELKDYMNKLAEDLVDYLK